MEWVTFHFQKKENKNTKVANDIFSTYLFEEKNTKENTIWMICFGRFLLWNRGVAQALEHLLCKHET
jgi:hypothetical protein